MSKNLSLPQTTLLLKVGPTMFSAAVGGWNLVTWGKPWRSLKKAVDLFRPHLCSKLKCQIGRCLANCKEQLIQSNFGEGTQAFV